MKIKWQGRGQSYSPIIFYELALLLVIFLFPAILFSLCASSNLIIFYELALSLVICPLPCHFIFIITLFISIITFLTKVCQIIGLKDAHKENKMAGKRQITSKRASS
jgi:hypothetical protein